MVDRSQNYNEIIVTEILTPQRKDDEVLVQIVAAGVNFVDLLYVSLSSFSFCGISIKKLFGIRS